MAFPKNLSLFCKSGQHSDAQPFQRGFTFGVKSNCFSNKKGAKSHFFKQKEGHCNTKEQLPS